MFKFIKSSTFLFTIALIAFIATVVHFSPPTPSQVYKAKQAAAKQQKVALAKPAPKYVPDGDLVMCEGNNEQLNALCAEINSKYHKINECEKADLTKNPECVAINKKVASYAKK